MDTRRISEEYTEIGLRLIETLPEFAPIRNSGITVVFLASEHEKRKGTHWVYGECSKIQEKHKWAIPCDFTVTIFEPNVKRFNERQMEALIYHELLHIEVDETTKKYRTVPHDLEDFKAVIRKYGIDWSEPGGDVDVREEVKGGDAGTEP